MPTSKTRFLVLQKKIEKQIFSVEERSSGDLLIGLTPPRTARIAGRTVEKPTSRKISVHVSPLSDPPVHTITHEIRFGLRPSHKGYAVVRKIENQPFIWPIFCHSFGTNEAKFVARRKSDEIRQISAYDSSIDTLLIGLFVTDSSYVIPESHGLSVTIKKLSRFNINLVTTFADVKSERATMDVFHYTSAVKDGNFIGQIGGNKAADTFDIRGLEAYLMRVLLGLSRRVLEKSNPLIIIPQSRHIQMRRYGRYPNGITSRESVYGEHSIVGSVRHTADQRMDPADSNSNGFSKVSESTHYELIREE